MEELTFGQMFERALDEAMEEADTLRAADRAVVEEVLHHDDLLHHALARHAVVVADLVHAEHLDESGGRARVFARNP